jgi:hypothetical protein
MVLVARRRRSGRMARTGRWRRHHLECAFQLEAAFAGVSCALVVLP